MAGMLNDICHMLSVKTPLEIISDLTSFDGYKHKFVLMVNTVNNCHWITDCLMSIHCVPIQSYLWARTEAKSLVTLLVYGSHVFSNYWIRQNQWSMAAQSIYHKISNIGHQIPKFKWFSSRLAVVFAQLIEARHWVGKEDVVGAVLTGNCPTACEWWTILIPAKVLLYITSLMVAQKGYLKVR